MSKPHEHTNKLERGRKTAISENVIIDFIMLEKGIFLEDLSFYTNQIHAWPIQNHDLSTVRHHPCGSKPYTVLGTFAVIP